jgi:hypothetical protein
VIPQANIIDGVPLINGVESPKRFSDTFKDGSDSRVSIVDQNIQFSILVFLDSFEECFNFSIIGMVNLNGDASTSSCLDLSGDLIKK